MDAIKQEVQSISRRRVIRGQICNADGSPLRYEQWDVKKLMAGWPYRRRTRSATRPSPTTRRHLAQFLGRGADFLRIAKQILIPGRVQLA